ncbi:MAG: hypothetical protein A3J24_10095 [Deltaproteobacteria bacterium RIFCSPLOWO2_02_FULL_53_8]|nr:MAG: hypothetical protein A3J24_10095 [Deltaproteobacteria bacterium RIFCSPLOWO2_02_FULL_53_8]
MLRPYRRDQKPRKDSSNIAVAFTIVLLFLGLSARLLAQQGGGESGSSQQGRNNQATTNPEGLSSGRAVSRIDESQLVGLPLNGRSYNQLATLEAGVSDTSSQSSSRGLSSGSLNVSGGRGTSNVFLLDGTNVMGMSNQGPRSAAGTQLSSDSVLQVLVFGTNYSAEYGRGSGGQLNSITRSGTPEFHGTLFEYLRNSKLDTRNFFDGAKPPPFKRNQFGFTVTGPIQKEQTFFMFGFEALRDRLTETDISTFPDEDAREGRITDEQGNLLRTVAVNPKVVRYLALFPDPALKFERLGNGVAEFRNPLFTPSDDTFAVLRVDHQFSLRDSMFVRYNFDDASSISGRGSYLFQGKSFSRQQYLTAMETHFFSASAINSFRFGYTRPSDQSVNFPQIQVPRELFFVPGAPDFGQLNIPRVTGFGNMGGPAANKFSSYQFSDSVVLQRGTHTIKFGTQIHRYHTDSVGTNFQTGVWSFNSLESFLRAPDGTEDKTTTLTVTLPGSDNSERWRQTLLGFYMDDSYKIRPNLQLDLGVRYEFSTVIHDVDGKSVFVADPLRDTGVKVGPYLDHNPSLRNLSPRLGISWSPGTSGNTVIRAGFGIYYDHLLSYTMNAKKNTAPFARKTLRTNFDHRPYFPDAIAAAEGTPLQVQVLDYQNLTTPMVLRYDLAVQQSLPGGWSSTFSYVGSRGNNLFRTYEFAQFPFPEIRSDGALFFPPQCNQIPPTLSNTSASEAEQLAKDRAVCRADAGPVNPAFAGGLDYTTSDGQSFYNSFRIAANKRLSSGTSLQVSYTLSKSVDDAEGEGAQYPHFRSVDRALSDFDTRHQVSFNYFYTLPFGRRQHWLNSGIFSNIFGEWRIGGITRYRTGTPFSPGMNVRRTAYLFETTRPNLRSEQSNQPAVEGVTAGCGTIKAGEELGTPRRYFDPCIYAFPDFGTLGNAGRNTITGPSVFGTDLSLQRDFGLGGDRRLQFRMEVFNPLNHTAFRGPGGSAIFSGAPGRINPSVGRITGTSTTSRQVQFALRLSF